jgi:hypothetical protein
VYAELSGDVPVGPAAARKCQNCLNFRHLELIGHRSIGSRQPPKAKVDNPISCASKWPVLARPQLAGFARPMTGINVGTLRYWINQHRRGGGVVDPAEQADLRKRNADLEREVARLRMERDILKKLPHSSRRSRREVRLD